MSRTDNEPDVVGNTFNFVLVFNTPFDPSSYNAPLTNTGTADVTVGQTPTFLPGGTAAMYEVTVNSEGTVRMQAGPNATVVCASVPDNTIDPDDTIDTDNTFTVQTQLEIVSVTRTDTEPDIVGKTLMYSVDFNHPIDSATYSLVVSNVGTASVDITQAGVGVSTATHNVLVQTPGTVVVQAGGPGSNVASLDVPSNKLLDSDVEVSTPSTIEPVIAMVTNVRTDSNPDEEGQDFTFVVTFTTDVDPGSANIPFTNVGSAPTAAVDVTGPVVVDNTATFTVTATSVGSMQMRAGPNATVVSANVPQNTISPTDEKTSVSYSIGPAMPQFTYETVNASEATVAVNNAGVVPWVDSSGTHLFADSTPNGSVSTYILCYNQPGTGPFSSVSAGAFTADGTLRGAMGVAYNNNASTIVRGTTTTGSSVSTDNGATYNVTEVTGSGVLWPGAAYKTADDFVVFVDGVITRKSNSTMATDGTYTTQSAQFTTSTSDRPNSMAWVPVAGRVCLCWVSTYPLLNVMTNVTTDDGATWEGATATTITYTTETSTYVGAVASSADNVYLFYVASSNTLACRVSTDAKSVTGAAPTFGGAVTITNEMTSADAFVVASIDGKPIVIFRNRNSGHIQYRWVVTDAATPTFSPVNTVYSENSVNTLGFAGCQVDADTVLFGFRVETSDFELKLGKLTL